MLTPRMRLTVLGSRGSIPVSRPGIQQFGGATSCYMVQADEETVFLDAGSGLLCAPSEYAKPPVILLSHLHLDHILGLGMFPRLSRPSAETRLFLQADSNEDALARLAGVFSPPYWPLPLTAYRGKLQVEPLRPSLRFGGMDVDCMSGRHPGSCTVFRLRYGGKSLVYATDYEPDEDSFAELTRFCAGAELILYDAQYTQAEAKERTGFGHSTAKTGLELLERSGARLLLLIHHAPDADDKELRRRERLLGRPDVRYAREGETILI